MDYWDPPKHSINHHQSSKPSKNEQSQQLRQFKVLEVELWQAQHSLYAQHFWPCTTSLCGQFYQNYMVVNQECFKDCLQRLSLKRVSLKRIKYESCRSQEGAEKRGLDCFGLKAELVQRLKEARAASAQDSTGADGSEVPSHEVPAHPFAAAEDSKKRKLDNAASSEASQDCNTMEWLCSKCSKSFTTKFNLTRHEKNPCRVLMLHVCPGKHGEGCPAEYSTNNKAHYDDHVKVCGIGRGGKREGAGSGGKREDAKRG